MRQSQPAKSSRKLEVVEEIPEPNENMAKELAVILIGLLVIFAFSCWFCSTILVGGVGREILKF